MKYSLKQFFLVIFFTLGYSILSFSQESTKNKPIHNPKKASLYSALLPGLGQAYNKKYWKIPIIYGSFGTLSYLYSQNYKNYILFKNAYTERLKNNNNDPFQGIYTTEDLKILKNYFRRNLELIVIISIGVYVLNIIDATVDAHLMQFDVSDDLSFKLTPSIDFDNTNFLSISKVYNINLTFNF